MLAHCKTQQNKDTEIDYSDTSIPLAWIQNNGPHMRAVRIDKGSTDGRIVESCDRNRLESFVRPVDVVAHPVDCNSFTVLNVCKPNTTVSVVNDADSSKCNCTLERHLKGGTLIFRYTFLL